MADIFYGRELEVFSGLGGVSLVKAGCVRFEERRMHAVIGPSGSGKTSLLRGMLGLLPCAGEVYLGTERLLAGTGLAGRVGFAPQFSIAQLRLSVAETFRFALEMTVADPQCRAARLEHILKITGLAEHAAKRVGALSGGQLRRLGLGLELVSDPPVLVCDEVTSGLDPRSEDQILAMLRTLVEEDGKTVICIIHNLSKLPQFDQVTVIDCGHLRGQYAPPQLLQQFGIDDFRDLYDALGRAGEEAAADEVDGDAPPSAVAAVHRQQALPGVCSQLSVLLRRRCLLFGRDHGYLYLTVAITLGFPAMVVIFALGGLPQIEGLGLERTGSFLDDLQANLRFQMEAAETAALVTGLIMFQVILLALIGSNNGAREIAAERELYDKERLAGLRPAAYILSKIVFVGALAVIQGAWMAVFVKAICGFPGDWFSQIALLAMACVSMSWVCLGFSALLRSADKASLLSVYLVGFQLPLSGVVLALPDGFVWLCRPFINAYWGWAGYLSSMRDSRLFDAWRLQDTSWLPSAAEGFTVLLLQGLAGLACVWWGCKRH